MRHGNCHEMRHAVSMELPGSSFDEKNVVGVHPMPRLEALEAALTDVSREYRAAFPDTLYAGDIQRVTHITPFGRFKKMFLTFPHPHVHTYSGLPALVATVTRKPGAKKSRVVLRVTDLIHDTHAEFHIPVSTTDADINGRAVETVTACIKKHMWRIGPADPDHYKE
jgi:hypothetical protein